VKAWAATFLPILLLAGCGEPAPSRDGAEGSTTPPYVRAEADNNLLEALETPIRVGELGPSFAACNARGTPRDRGSAEPVAVRAAPYDAAGEIDRLPAGAEFFICTRSQDEHWFGIVYDEGGRASERCGVGGPIPARRTYLGPCAAGWVSSALVRLTSGVPRAPADSAPATR
jgi:hypothetical protein